MRASGGGARTRAAARADRCGPWQHPPGAQRRRAPRARRRRATAGARADAPGASATAPRRRSAPARAHKSSVQRSGTMRASIHAATASIMTPKSCLTVSIQAPALGRNLPAEAPTRSSGTPMPRLIAKSAAAPRTMSPLWPMTARVATSGGATQVVMMSADSAPITATPTKEPACWRLLSAARRVCMRRRHLQRKEAKHRQREHDKEQRKQHHDPRLLKHGLHLLAGGGEQRARDGVGDRHAQYVDERERQRAPGTSPAVDRR